MIDNPKHHKPKCSCPACSSHPPVATSFSPHSNCTTHYEHTHVILAICDLLGALKIDCSQLLDTPIYVDPNTGTHYIMEKEASGHISATTRRTIY